MPPKGKPCGQFIEDAKDRDHLIVRDRTSPAYVAVATAATKPIVEARIESRGKAATTVPDWTSLARSVLLAFCVRLDDGDGVFLRKTPPFKYQTNRPNSEEAAQFLTIEDRYRRKAPCHEHT